MDENISHAAAPRAPVSVQHVKLPPSTARSAPSLIEYTVLMAMLSALGAFSIDTMLPGIGMIGADLSPDAPQRAMFVIGAFFLGLGVGTFFTGPLCDAYGRKPVVLYGIALYCFGALLAWAAPTIEVLLFARVLQGLGVAGPRVATMAITRDLYSGREMASIISLSMMIFSVVPAAAPFIGTYIIAFAGWRAIFLCFIVFGATAALWLWWRQPETLTPQAHRPFRPAQLRAGMIEVLSIKSVRATILVLSLTFSMLFVTLSTAHQVFDETFHRDAQFANWFAVIALLAAFSGFFNSRIVLKLGMRRVVIAALSGQAGLAATMTLLASTGLGMETLFYAYVLWLVSVFLTTGFCIGNLNTMGLRPLGHLAGIGSSIISATSTLLAVLITSLVGLFFDASPLVPAAAVALAAIVGLFCLRLGRDQRAPAALACLAKS